MIGVVVASSLGQIARVVYGSIVASVVVSGVFALAVLGLGRASETRRHGRQLIANGYVLLAACSLLFCAAAVVYGVILVGRKG